MRHPKNSWSFLWFQSAKPLLTAVLIGFSSFAESNEPFRPGVNFETYLQDLPGFWKGEAIETPVGSMSYDIFFYACSNGIIAGVAKTGASLHYWQFKPGEDNLSLRFLSTFRGNRKPILLLPRSSEGAILKYYAPEQNFLTLEITFSDPIINIQVFHHDKHHVHIRLTRAKNRLNEPSPHHTLSNSCRGYPIRKLNQIGDEHPQN